MRDYEHIERYLDALLVDIYPQPSGNDEHTELARQVIDLWMSRLPSCKTVLDVGCGEAFCQPMFEKWGVEYEGICLAQDFIVAKERGMNVKNMDFTFLEYKRESFDLIFSRHSFEHSPMPLLTLMEWHRVSKQWLGLIVPAPQWHTFEGQNHYSVMLPSQLETILDRAGWKILWNESGMKSRGMLADGEGKPYYSPPELYEYRLFCEKIK